jgi:hypothetical protein
MKIAAALRRAVEHVPQYVERVVVAIRPGSAGTYKSSEPLV